MLSPQSVAAALGMLAFSVCILAGLWVGNPVSVILSRALAGMVVFTIIGLATGWAAQIVVREHVSRREETLIGSAKAQSDRDTSADAQEQSTQGDTEPMGT